MQPLRPGETLATMAANAVLVAAHGHVTEAVNRTAAKSKHKAQPVKKMRLIHSAVIVKPHAQTREMARRLRQMQRREAKQLLQQAVQIATADLGMGSPVPPKT